MRDQAEQLRAKLKMQHGVPAKTLAVASGKGGVGKSNISVNLAMALAGKGKKVLLFDLDVGMGNIHVLLGLDASYTISDLSTGISRLPKLYAAGRPAFPIFLPATGLLKLSRWKKLL